MDVFNVTTRRKDNIDDPAKLSEAILNGTHAFAQGTSVIVKAPDGTMGKIPSSNAIDAIRAGYQIETNSQRAVREYVEENQGLKGAVKVGLGQFADETALGLPELIFNKTGDPLEVAKKDALKKEHALANTLGGLAGFGASMFFGGPLWKTGTKAGEKVGAHIAEKLAAEAGEQTVRKSFQNAGAEIAGKIGGGITEGAITTAPHAITEAALGDPEAAAETMLAGVGIGALFGGAQGLGKEFLGLGKKVGDEAARAVGEQDLTIKKLSRRLAQSMTNVSEDDIAYYLKNRDKVNQAPAFEALKDEIDQAYKNLDDDALFKREALRDNEIKLDLAYQNAQRDMAQTRAPQEMADELVASLDNQGALLKQMKNDALDALEQSGVELKRDDLVDLITSIKQKAIPKETGRAAKSAAKSLDEFANDVKTQYDETIDARFSRFILDRLYKETKFLNQAGRLDEETNRLFKNIAFDVAEKLRAASPEYAQRMKALAERVSSLDKMSKVFGDEKKAASALTRMLKPGQDIDRRMLDEYSALTGEDFSSRFGQLVKTKEQLEAIKRGEDLKSQLVPNLFRKNQELQIASRNAAEKLAKVRKISPLSSEKAIRRMGHKNPDIDTRRAFEQLSEMTGKDYLDLIKDRNVLDQFDKAFRNGSTKTNLAGVLGGAASFALGADPIVAAGLAATGVVAGPILDTYGGRILKNMLDRPNVAGLLFAEKAIKKSAQEIDRVPGILERLSLKEKKIGKRIIAIDAIYRLTDSNKDKNTGEQLEEIGDKLRTWLADPTQFQDMIGKFAAPLAEGGAPMISEGLTIGATKALSYLAANIPKPPAPSSPFAPKITWNPSDFELNKFARIAQVAENPFSVLDELEEGTLTSDHVDALKAMFPPVYNAVQQKIIEAATNSPKPLSYNDRVRLSILTEVPLDDSLTDAQLLSLQKRFMAGQDEEPDMNEAQFSPQQDIKMSKANLTTMQQALI